MCRAARRAEREHKLEEQKHAREELAALSAPERLSFAAQDAMRSFKVDTHTPLHPTLQIDRCAIDEFGSCTLASLHAVPTLAERRPARSLRRVFPT